MGGRGWRAASGVHWMAVCLQRWESMGLMGAEADMAANREWRPLWQAGRQAGGGGSMPGVVSKRV